MAYSQWVRDGQPFIMCTPGLHLRATLGRYGYTGPATGYPDLAHLTAIPPEDHTPFSATGWPGPSPYPYCMAIDIMPNSGIDIIALGTRLVEDKNRGVPGTEPIKYINWTDRAGNVWHDEWMPNHSQYPSGDSGHIHISFRTDYHTSDVMEHYDPLGVPTMAHRVRDTAGSEYFCPGGIVTTPDGQRKIGCYPYYDGRYAAFPMVQLPSLIGNSWYVDVTSLPPVTGHDGGGVADHVHAIDISKTGPVL